MATTVDTLITKYDLQGTNYKKEAKDIADSTKGIGDAMNMAKSGLDGFLGMFGKVAGIGFGALKAFAGAAAGVGGAVIGLAAYASKAAADMDSLRKGLTAVTGSTEEAERQLKQLKEVAKLPGLGFQEAVQGAINLQAAGMSADMAQRALAGFGNALATVGKGKQELEGVITALSQIISKGSVSAEEINQIAERVPQIRKLMKDAFGTANTEDLQKMGLAPEQFIAGVVAELEKLPKAAGGAKNAFENLQDAMWQGFVAAGDVINTYLVPAIETVSNFLTYMTESGLIKSVVQGFTDMFNTGDASSTLVKALSWVAALFKNMPKIVKGIGQFMSDVFKTVGDNIQKVLTGAFAIFTAGTILKAIVTLIPAVAALASAWTAVAAAEATAVGLTGAGLAIVAAAAAAGIGVYVGLNNMINGLKKDFNVIGDGNKYGIPTLDDINADAKDIEAGFAQFQKDQKAKEGGDKKTHAAQSLNLQQQIAKNTATTAKNTEEARESLQRFILGGGDYGKLGVTPLEHFKRKGGTINVAGGSRAFKEAMAEIVYEVMQSMGVNELAAVRR